MTIFVSANTINQNIQLSNEAELQWSFITKPISQGVKFIRQQHPAVQVGAAILAPPVVLGTVSGSALIAANTLGVAMGATAYGGAIVGTAAAAAGATGAVAVATGGGLAYILTRPRDKVCGVHFECDDMGVQSGRTFSEPRII